MEKSQALPAFGWYFFKITNHQYCDSQPARGDKMTLARIGQRDELSQGMCESWSARTNTLALFPDPERCNREAKMQ
jgi:hypothetical protein